MDGVEHYRRVYAIGDVHGHHIGLIHILSAIRDDGYDESEDHIVFLGDYIDRGPSSASVVDHVRKMQERGAATALRGNHEQMMVDACKAGENTPEWDSWWYQGGRETAASFSNTRKIPTDVIEWAESLPLVFTFGGHILVHAGLRPHVPLEHQESEDMLWIREEFLESDFEFPYIVVHGHTSVKKPEVRSNRIGIDTVLRTGAITAVRLESFSRPVFVRHMWKATA